MQKQQCKYWNTVMHNTKKWKFQITPKLFAIEDLFLAERANRLARLIID